MGCYYYGLIGKQPNNYFPIKIICVELRILFAPYFMRRDLSFLRQIRIEKKSHITVFQKFTKINVEFERYQSAKKNDMTCKT